MASAALGSCLSTTVTSHLCSKLVSSDAGSHRILSCHRPCRLLSVAHTRDNAHAPIVAWQGRRSPNRRTLAAVAQDEATAAIEEAEETVSAQGSEEEPEAQAQAAEDAAAVQSTKLYFGNLPYNCDSAQLAGIIQEYASPELVEVLYDRETGRSRGFAFVTMSTVEECEQVISHLDGSQYGGRTMRVNFADKPKPKAPLYPETEHKLFVGNLAWSVTSESLTQVFQEHGNVVGARVLYDGDSGRSRGYGFVCYSSREEMESAMQVLNGVELDGREMRISIALGKKS